MKKVIMLFVGLLLLTASGCYPDALPQDEVIIEEPPIVVVDPPKEEPKVYNENEIYFQSDFNQNIYPKTSKIKRTYYINNMEIPDMTDGYYDTSYDGTPKVRYLSVTSDVGLEIRVQGQPVPSNIEIYRYDKKGNKIIIGSGFSPKIIIPNVEVK